MSLSGVKCSEIGSIVSDPLYERTITMLFRLAKKKIYITKSLI